MTFFCTTDDTCKHGIKVGACAPCQLFLDQVRTGGLQCDGPCVTHGFCRYLTRQGKPCHWDAHAPGWSDLSRTGKLIWLHARRLENAR